MSVLDFNFGLVNNPINITPFFNSNELVEETLPPGESLWVESGTGSEMLTPDGKSYVFLT